MKKLDIKWEPLNKEQLVETVVDDDFLRAFFIKSDIDTTFIENNLQSLFVFKVENDKCANCDGLDRCKQDLIGQEPKKLN